MRLLKRLSRFTLLTDSLAPVCSKAISPEAVSAAKKAGHVCLTFAKLESGFLHHRDDIGFRLRQGYRLLRLALEFR